MIWGILSDTHKDRMNAIPHIIAEFKKRGVEVIIHCGDIKVEHLDPDLFGKLPVVCALVEEQAENPKFATPPNNWRFTRPKDRIIDIGDTRLYVGHKRAFEFLAGSEAKLMETLNTIRRDHEWVRWLFSGHTHHQIYNQSHLINFVNPGAVEDSFDGFEFAIINTEIDEIIFSRILPTTPTKKPFSIGAISDSLNISELDPYFWKGLAEKFKENNVGHIIHCGNLALEDVGQEELKDFEVHYNLRPDQTHVKNSPKNWHLIPQDEPVVKINGYRFYVQLDLGATLLEQSEYDMHLLCLNLRRKHPEISFVLCGFTNNAFLEEGEEVRIINPGDVVKDRSFAVITLPCTEITFGHVPVEPLLPIDKSQDL